MACKTCDELLAVYKREVRLFTNVLLNTPGVPGDDSSVTFQELDRLSQNCRGANEALLAHLRQEHTHP
jgi:hypothetical protein